MSNAADLSTLLAEREITRTLHRYSQAVDYCMEAEWVDCFTEDGTYEVRGDVLPESVIAMRTDLIGREALRRFIDARAQGVREDRRIAFQKHLPVVPLIEVDGDEATVVSHFVGLDREDGLPVVRDIGQYRDKFVKCADGRWRINHRIYEAEAFRPHPGRD